MKHPDAEHKIGTFELTQPVARISDPCYDKDTWCAGTIKNCKTGQWEATVYHYDEGSWGGRVGNLVAYHSSFPAPEITDSRWVKTDIDVGVDAGQAGIFDDKYFKDDNVVKGVARLGGEDNEPICVDEPWYSICCDRSMSDKQAGVIPYGCNSSSGYGDGSYDAYYIKSKGKVVAIMIDFGLSAENEEDEDACECCNCLGMVDYVDENGFCEDCHNARFDTCIECGNEFDKDDLDGGLCSDCKEEIEEEVEDNLS